MPDIRKPIQADGAVITVEVEVGPINEAGLGVGNLPIPTPFSTTALIDTGASRTVIHPMIVRVLRLIPHDVEFIWTAGPAGPVQAKVSLYNVSLTLGGYPVPRFPVEAAEAVPATSSVLVIIGRDVLNGCKFLFDGPTRSFNLEF